MRPRRRRWSRRRRNKRRGIDAFTGAVIDQISPTAAGRDRIVIAFAVEKIVAALAEKLIAATIGLRSVGSKIAVDVIDGIVLAGVGWILAVNHVVISAAQEQIGAGVAGNQ